MNPISLYRLTYGCLDAQTLRVPDRFLLLNVKLDQSVGEEKLEKEEGKKTHQLKFLKVVEQPAWQQLCEDTQTSTCLFQDLIKKIGFRLIHVTFLSIAKLVHLLQGYITTLTYTINQICSGTGYEIKSDMSCVC